jgi:hypothetical protein
MDFSKQPIYSVDYGCALVVAIALTILVANAIRSGDYRAWQRSPALLWLLAIGTWACGFVILRFGELIARWLPLAAGAVSLVIIVFAALHSLLPAR